MNALKLISCFLFCIHAIYAQKDLPKVSLKDIGEKFYPADSTAAAAILYNVGRTSFVYSVKNGFTAIHEYQMRIKIYKKEGLRWATFQVPYFIGYESLHQDYVKFSNGITYNIENGAIVKTKLTGEGTFKRGINEFWDIASITMPNVKVGSIIEFKYTLTSADLIEFPIFNFQYEIPVMRSEYVTEIPEFFIYKPVVIGFCNIKTDFKVGNGFQNFSNEHNQTVNASFQQINSIYTGENLPALQEEPYVDNLQNYRAAVQHELSHTRFHDEPEKNYAMSWGGVAKTIFKDKRFGKELEERLYFEQDLPPVVRSATTDFEKANAILQFVKHTMNWNGKTGYFTKTGVKAAYAGKSGNIAEINFILISMLNHVGITANPVLASTIQNGIPVFPNRTRFNYVIAAATIDGKQYLMDAANKNTTINVLPLQVLNWTGRLIRQDGTSEEIALVPQTPSKRITNLMLTVDAGRISGKTRVQHTDYHAFVLREKYTSINKTDYIEKLAQELGEITISDYAIDNIADFFKPITETFAFISENHCEIIGGKIYIRPILSFAPNQNPFILESRKLPLYFGFPQLNKYTINIQIPDGYEAEYLPKPITVSTGENICLFSYSISKSGKNIQLAISMECNAGIVSASFYESIREFYQKMTDKLNERIILKKVQQ